MDRTPMKGVLQEVSHTLYTLYLECLICMGY